MPVTHPVLLRQLKRSGVNEEVVPTLEQWQAILSRVDKSYHDSDQGQYLNELSINVSSHEMSSKNNELQEVIDKLRNTQASLIRSEKMATIGQLSSGVAHQINNPLTYLLFNIGIIHKRLLTMLKLLSFYKDIYNTFSDEKLSDISDEIIVFIKDNQVASIAADSETLISETKEGLLRIKEIVLSLGKFSSSKNEEMHVIDINKCLEAAIEMVRNKLERKCKIEINLGNIPRIVGISSELQVVFINILINAEQSIHGKGRIIITSKSTDTNIIVSIADDGVGIRSENMSKLFTPFFTTREMGEGVGLGLSIAYGIIELHGGTISAESKQGYGSIFTVTLPLPSDKY